MFRPWNEKDIEQTALNIRAVAHPLPLAIVCLLVDGECGVGEICASGGAWQLNVAHICISGTTSSC